MLICVINLDSSVKRLYEIKQKLDEQGIGFLRVSAVNGKDLSESYINSITYPQNHFKSKVLFPRMLTRGEIGCFLSHRKCWSMLLESKEKFAVIMEDDVLISKNAWKFLRDEIWENLNINICKLSLLKDNIDYEIDGKSIKVDGDTTLEVPLWPEPLGTQCYLISREAAKLALKLSNKLIAPVDNFLFSKWFQLARRYDVWAMNPFIFKENCIIPSDIGNRNRKSVKKSSFLIRHGITRWNLNRIVDKKRHSDKTDKFIFVQ